MKKKELKKLTKDQAIKTIDKLKKDLFNFRFQKTNVQLTSPSKVNTTKKSIARLKTILEGKLNV
jgi:large subunit ribosomal protein L29